MRKIALLSLMAILVNAENFDITTSKGSLVYDKEKGRLVPKTQIVSKDNSKIIASVLGKESGGDSIIKGLMVLKTYNPNTLLTNDKLDEIFKELTLVSSNFRKQIVQETVKKQVAQKQEKQQSYKEEIVKSFSVGDIQSIMCDANDCVAFINVDGRTKQFKRGDTILEESGLKLLDVQPYSVTIGILNKKGEVEYQREIQI